MSANDPVYEVTDQQILDRSEAIAGLGLIDPAIKQAMVTKAKAKLRLFGDPNNYTEEQRKQILELIQLSLLIVAESDLRCGYAAPTLEDTDLIRRIHLAMDHVAQVMLPQFSGRES